MKTQRTQPTKTVAQVGVIKKAVAITKTALIVLVAVIVPATFLSSVFFPKTPSSLTEIKSERSAKSNEIEEYIENTLQNDAHYLALQSEYKELNNTYQEKKQPEYIFGFPSLHKFLWNFGIGLIILTLSIYLLCTINLFHGLKRKAANFTAMLFMTAAGFYMAWIFFPENDLPVKAYFTALFAIGILSAISAYFVTKIRLNKVEEAKAKIRFVMDKLILEIPQYVKDRIKYDEDIVEPTLDKLDE